MSERPHGFHATAVVPVRGFGAVESELGRMWSVRVDLSSFPWLEAIATEDHEATMHSSWRGPARGGVVFQVHFDGGSCQFEVPPHVWELVQEERRLAVVFGAGDELWMLRW